MEQRRPDPACSTSSSLPSHTTSFLHSARFRAVRPPQPVLPSQRGGRHARHYAEFVVIGHERRVLYITHLTGEKCSQIKISLVAACAVNSHSVMQGVVWMCIAFRVPCTLVDILVILTKGWRICLAAMCVLYI